MNKDILQISISFGLINVMLGYVFSLLNLGSFLSLNMIFSISLFLIITGTAHYFLYKKNNNSITITEVFLVGSIIIGITFLYSIFMQLLTNNISDYFLFTLHLLKSSLPNLAFNFLLLLVLIFCESMAIIYHKAGKSAWAAIIPFYNVIVFLEIIEKPIWWTILLFIPIINIPILIMITDQLAKKFNQDSNFTIGLLLLPFVYYPILGFGEAKYSL